MEPSVCAIVVTFHPDQDVIRNLTALSGEVLEILVVDNGSSAASLDLLRQARASLGFGLIENGENLGIATALNIGIRGTTSPWILLFDQDSRVTPGFAQDMLRCFQSSRWGDRLGLLVPRYEDQRSGTPIQPERLSTGSLAVAMTSGSLLRRETFDTYGLFADELFIDSVDHEYSLRLRAANLILGECAEAVLLHSPGTPTHYRWLGLGFQTDNYSPIRLYYQERNKLWLFRRYFLKFPRYCSRQLLVSVKSFVKILLLEQDKRRKFSFFLKGICAGLLGKTGRLNLPSA